jgi:hypothetical protein
MKSKRERVLEKRFRVIFLVGEYQFEKTFATRLEARLFKRYAPNGVVIDLAKAEGRTK